MYRYVRRLHVCIVCGAMGAYRMATPIEWAEQRRHENCSPSSAYERAHMVADGDDPQEKAISNGFRCNKIVFDVLFNGRFIFAGRAENASSGSGRTGCECTLSHTHIAQNWRKKKLYIFSLSMCLRTLGLQSADCRQQRKKLPHNKIAEHKEETSTYCHPGSAQCTVYSAYWKTAKANRLKMKLPISKSDSVN